MDIQRGFLRRLLFLLAVLVPLLARAEADPPGRVGRLAELQGHVWLYDPDQGEWLAADRNRPLTSGDRLATDADARAELRIGSTTLRLGAGSELELLRLDDARLSFQLHHGALALRLRSREVAAQTDVLTEEVRLQPLRSGHYRVDRIDDSTFAGSWRGGLRVGEGADAFTVESGQRVEVWREGVRDELQSQPDAMPRDDFAAWVASADASDERSAANRYVSPEMTGAEDLDRNGRWEQAPDFGPVWVPYGVAADWAPYRFGHWAWVLPWGWTWIDDAPWGFAPFHYGRWLHWGGRWCWSPGAYHRHPVYAPALVAWIGGPNFSVSIGIGGPLLPAVGWVPLAPREPFVPYYRASPGYEDRLNQRPRGAPRPVRPVIHTNQAVPGALTVVAREVIEHRQAVAPARVDVDAPPQHGRPVAGVAPLPPPARPRTAPREVPPPPGTRSDWRRALPMPGGTAPAQPALQRPPAQVAPQGPPAQAAPQRPPVQAAPPQRSPVVEPGGGPRGGRGESADDRRRGGQRDERGPGAPSLRAPPVAPVGPRRPLPETQEPRPPAAVRPGPERPSPAPVVPTRPTPPRSAPERPSAAPLIPVQPPRAQPVPVRPAPTQSAPVQPTPTQPAPVQATPARPRLERPLPERSAPERQRPEHPTPASPSAERPAPQRPVPGPPTPERAGPMRPAPAAPAARPVTPQAPVTPGVTPAVKPAPPPKEVPPDERRRRIPEPADKPQARE